MKRTFSFFYLNDISTYRSELMGWSILWIMMLHFTFTQIKPLGFLAQYGFAGVDIFMLVSGFGLYFSLEKDDNLWHFYKKRLLRIFPTYYILGVFSSLLLFHDDIMTYLFRYTTVGYWTGGVFNEWYIPAIVAFYLLAPFIRQLFVRSWFVVIVAIVVVNLLIAYQLIEYQPPIDMPHFLMSYRLPAFILGMACAYWIKNGITAKYFFLLLLLGLSFFILIYPHHHEYYYYKFYSLLFLLPLFTICFILLSKLLHKLMPIISTMGKASLEIYLTQWIFFYAICSGMMPISSAWHDLISFGLIVICSILGIAAHWLIDKGGINRLL